MFGALAEPAPAAVRRPQGVQGSVSTRTASGAGPRRPIDPGSPAGGRRRGRARETKAAPLARRPTTQVGRPARGGGARRPGPRARRGRGPCPRPLPARCAAGGAARGQRARQARRPRRRAPGAHPGAHVHEQIEELLCDRFVHWLGLDFHAQPPAHGAERPRRTRAGRHIRPVAVDPLESHAAPLHHVPAGAAGRLTVDIGAVPSRSDRNRTRYRRSIPPGDEDHAGGQRVGAPRSRRRRRRTPGPGAGRAHRRGGRPGRRRGPTPGSSAATACAFSARSPAITPVGDRMASSVGRPSTVHARRSCDASGSWTRGPASVAACRAPCWRPMAALLQSGGNGAVFNGPAAARRIPGSSASNVLHHPPRPVGPETTRAVGIDSNHILRTPTSTGTGRSCTTRRTDHALRRVTTTMIIVGNYAKQAAGFRAGRPVRQASHGRPGLALHLRGAELRRAGLGP